MQIIIENLILFIKSFYRVKTLKNDVNNLILMKKANFFTFELVTPLKIKKKS